VENGLSNRRIFDIQKDSVGYMWFLTNEGIDRYNGKDIKHYKLIEENKESSFPIHLGWLYFEEKGKLWVIGKAGRIFQYNQEHDVFNRVYKLPKTPVNISYGYMDCNHRIWLCSRYSIALYDTQTGEVHQMSNELKSSITSIEQVDNNHFFSVHSISTKNHKDFSSVLLKKASLPTTYGNNGLYTPIRI